MYLQQVGAQGHIEALEGPGAQALSPTVQDTLIIMEWAYKKPASEMV